MAVGIYGDSAEDRYSANLLARHENEWVVTDAMITRARDLQVATLANEDTWLAFDQGYEFSYSQRKVLHAMLLALMEQRYAHIIELAQIYGDAFFCECLEIVQKETENDLR